MALQVINLFSDTEKKLDRRSIEAEMKIEPEVEQIHEQKLQDLDQSSIEYISHDNTELGCTIGPNVRSQIQPRSFRS